MLYVIVRTFVSLTANGRKSVVVITDIITVYCYCCVLREPGLQTILRIYDYFDFLNSDNVE